MKYILNETPLKTTNNFRINNIELDLEVPEVLDEYNYNSNDYNKDKIKITSSIKNDFNSRIGLSTQKYNSLDIDIVDNTNDKLILEFNIKENLISEININIGSNSNMDIIIKCLSNNKVFNYLKQVTNIKSNSNLNLSLINLLDKDSINLVAIESNIDNDSKLDYNYIDLGSNIKISNYYSKLIGLNSINNFNNIYLGDNSNILDMNYYIGCVGINTNANITSEGVLNDYAIKNYKGTIDFVSGCKKSVGKELENCILLSDTAKSKSLPMLLCTEEDVSGSHGVSTGKIDKEKLFYLESKGLCKEDAIKLIINANFNKILKNINNELIVSELNEYIESRV